jgi:hypothetical protein
MTDQAKHQIRLARIEALLDYYPLHQFADLGEDGVKLAETRFVLVQGSDDGSERWHVGADGVQELLNYQERDEGGWYAIGIWDLDEGLVASVETTCYVGDFSDHIDPSIYDVKPEPEGDDSSLAFEIADAIVNDGGYADDGEESDRRAAERDRIAAIVQRTLAEEVSA